MPSTFFGLTIASSGLSAYQVALNTSANNISNVQTKDTANSRQTVLLPNPSVPMQNTAVWEPVLRPSP